jgi:hypothetical protein
MNTRVLSLLPVLALAGCAAADTDHNFSHMVGTPVDRITQQLGRPTAVLQPGDVRVVGWRLVRRDPIVRIPLTWTNTADTVSRGFMSSWGGATLDASMPPLYSLSQTSRWDYLNAYPSRPSYSSPSPSPSPSMTLTGYSTCKVWVVLNENDVVSDYQFEGEINACYSVSRNFTTKG